MTRKKTVYSTAGEVMHEWAYKRNNEARSRNCFVDDNGEKIYSYGKHYCLGRHLPDGSVALNLESSSSTTNGQRSDLRRATSHLRQYEVFNPGGEPDRERTLHAIERLLGLASRAKQRKERYVAEAQTIADDFNAVCDILKLSKVKFKRIVVAGNDEDLAAIRKSQEVIRKAEAARRRAEEKKRAEECAEQVAAWRSGVTHYCPSGVGTLLRLTFEGEVVETSHHAHIPVEDAKRLWPIIQRTMKGERDYEVGMPLGDYRLTKIRRDGSIVVGCHDISRQEIEGIAHQLGLIDTSAQQRAFDALTKA